MPDGLLIENGPQNIIRISVLPQTNCSDVPAYLMLELVQATEGSGLLWPRQVKTEGAAMNRQLVGYEGEKDLFVGICEGQVPISQLVVIHAALSASCWKDSQRVTSSDASKTCLLLPRVPAGGGSV